MVVLGGGGVLMSEMTWYHFGHVPHVISARYVTNTTNLTEQMYKLGSVH